MFKNDFQLKFLHKYIHSQFVSPSFISTPKFRSEFAHILSPCYILFCKLITFHALMLLGQEKESNIFKRWKIPKFSSTNDYMTGTILMKYYAYVLDPCKFLDHENSYLRRFSFHTENKMRDFYAHELSDQFKESYAGTTNAKIPEKNQAHVEAIANIVPMAIEQ
mmetsp:Transcript_48841/g.58903  ORF Transcript_48841/g.58903 Transcript_48841/m.58903 type:complete len:164 (-) Transcript_48841:496-987(-)